MRTILAALTVLSIGAVPAVAQPLGYAGQQGGTLRHSRNRKRPTCWPDARQGRGRLGAGHHASPGLSMTYLPDGDVR